MAAALLVISALFIGVASAAAYALRPGDKLELKVVGLPELGQRTAINVDGEITFPLIGSMKVAGLTVAQVEEKVRAILPSKVFYRRSPDGKKFAYVAETDEITVEIAEYRPIYVSGDVPNPGEQVYRPGMRVRQALALAGGYNFLRSHLGVDLLTVVDFQGNRDTLAVEYAAERAKYARIQAELNDISDPKFGELAKRLPSAPGVMEAVNLEAEQFKMRTADWRKEVGFLQDNVARATTRASVLAKQFDTENRGSVADAEELERMKALLEKGMTSTNRITDTRRAMLLSATRALQVSVQLTIAENEKNERARFVDRSTDQRRMDLTRELQASTAHLAQVKSRIEINDRKLAFLSKVNSQLSTGKLGKVEIVISRDTGDGQQKIEASLDTVLTPGDVVEVTYKYDGDLGLPTAIQ
jgi:polysaccharide export outer membrane protein